MQIIRPEDRKRRRLSYWLVMGGGGSRDLIGSGVLRAPLVLTRAQAAGIEATGFTGVGLQGFGADVPRFVAPASRLLIEDQRTNSIRNPRCEGAVAGTPGTNPTNWATFPTGGVSFNIVGSGVEAGIPYVDIRLSGTSTTGLALNMRADQTYPTAAQNEVWTHSVFMRLVGGTLTGITNTQILVNEFTAANVFLTGGSAVFTVGSGPLQSGRLSHTRTLTDATVGRAGSQVSFAVQTGVAIDATFRIGAPQLELGGFASTPIFPPVSAPATSTRGADLVSAPLSSLGIGGNGACTVLFRGLCPVDFSLLTEGQIATISDGTFNNFARLVVTGAGGAGQLVMARRTAGADDIAVLPGGARPTNTLFSAGIAFHGTGRLTAAWSGSSLVTELLGAPTSGYTTMDLFHLRNILPLVCEVQRVQVLPRAVSDADLAALVAAF